ncbi:MAG: SLBB domain-containing protein, partial [Fibrobacterota bacterium]
SIKGEVRNPGTYPLETGAVLSAREVVSVSGGITENGDSGRVYIIRKDPLGNLSNRIGKEFGDNPLRKNPLGQRMIASGDYRIIPLRKTSVTLENDDIIVVPEISKTVFVSGNIRKPGAYQYVEDKPMKYYIKLAGGMTKKADRRNSSIITAYSDYWVVKTTPEIEAGDLVLVPDRPQNERMQRYELVIRSIYYIATTISVGIAVGRALDLIDE